MVGKKTLLALAGAFGLGIAFLAAPEVALAQCCAPPPPPPCCAPPPPCCQPPSPPPVTPPCCTPGHNINVPGVNVFVGAAVVVNAQVNAQASARAGGEAGGFVFFGGGGGGGGFAPPTPNGVIQGLNVEGAQAMRRVSYQATRTRVRRVVIQAFCLDSRSRPHPAAQVTPDRDIDESYDGELYRCIAGTHMQVTIANYDGRISFDGGDTITCRRGEALYHVPRAGRGEGEGEGFGGRLECRPQRPARDCNERSLLRRFGAGVKIFTMIRTETYTAWREERVQESSVSSSAFMMDGGVGGIVF